MLRIAICDDNKTICWEMEQILLAYEKNMLCPIEIELFHTGEGLIDFIKYEHPFDLIFLDIDLGSMTGVTVGKTIREVFHDHSSKIVFISGADGYEMELFPLQPLNFLRKPIQKKNVFDCINLAKEMLDLDHTYFEYKARRQIQRVAFRDILYLESRLKKIKIVTMHTMDEFYGSLEKIKPTLPKHFISPHNSFVIHFHHVIRIQKDMVIMANGDCIPISQRNLTNIRTMQIEIEREKRDARL